MKATILGTGTSQGVPVIGCTCPACSSTDYRDKRLRSSVIVESDTTAVLIDTSPDLRYQMLRAGINKVDTVLYTHEHNDHVIGLDDIRPFNFRARKDMPVYAMERVVKDLKVRFDYVFTANPYPGAPRVMIHEIQSGDTVKVGDISVTAFEVMHGNLPILGYRIGDFSFITDANEIPKSSKDIIAGSKNIVINALRKSSHHSHFSLSEAISILEELGPDAGFLSHISHDMGVTSEWENELPDFIYPAYDGLQIEIGQ